MRLQRLWLKHFRNLRDVTINFAQHYEASSRQPKDAEPKPIHSHALIGQNGTGKSNLMEAVIAIFRGIDLGWDIEFDYELEYEICGHSIKVKGDIATQKRPLVWVDGEKKFLDYLRVNDDPREKEKVDPVRGPRLLPSHVFAYYSGQNIRMEVLFQEHQRRFNHRQEITAEEVLPVHVLDSLSNTDADREMMEELRKQEENKRLRQFGDDRLRRLFYCRGGHSQLVLLACLLSDDPVFQNILKNLHIESLESALFVLKQPHRLRKLDEDDILQGDPRFWYARGNVVSEFLDKLWQVAWAPIQNEESKLVDFRGRREKQKQLYLYVPDKEKLKELGELIGSPASFFRYAEGAYIGDLIEEVRITVKKSDEHGGKVGFTQLSEGELQMLTVLGLMRITRMDDCLFLLDEPDTHLNPIWKLRYFDEIEAVLKPETDTATKGESQILVTTHDPIMVGGLKRKQVHILRKQGRETEIFSPDVHPQGMGVTGLLKSELFGLSSTLDPETERRLYRRNELFALGEERTVNEDEELTYLSTELADLGFSTTDFKDPVYALFAKKMAQRNRLAKAPVTAAEKAEQDAIAEEIINEILNEE